MARHPSPLALRGPSLRAAFLLEATLYAWKNLGYDEEAKKYLEDSFEPDIAYLLAIIFNPWFKEEMRANADLGYRDTSSAAIFSSTWDRDPPCLNPILRSLHKKTDPKLPSILKSDAHRIAKMTPDQAEEYFLELGSRTKGASPEGYHDSGTAFAKSLGGWSWHKVKGAECSDYEGALMQHCGVADRGEMFSLRDKKGVPHVTMEIDLSSSPWTVYQCKGKQNHPPAQKYWPYVLDFLKQMAAENGPANWVESYERDPEHFLDAVAAPGDVIMVDPSEWRPEDEQQFFADPVHEPDPNCEQCQGNVPPGRVCPTCGGSGDETPEEQERMHAQLRQGVYPDREPDNI